MISTLILALATLVGPRFPPSGTTPPPSAVPPRPYETAAPLTESVPDLLHELASKDPEVTQGALSVLELRMTKEQDPFIRQVVFQRVAAFVRDHTEPLPKGGSYAYCSPLPARTFPPEALTALRILGNRRDADLDEVLDLSGTNLSYAGLPNLRLDSIKFDNALMCRAIVKGSTFNGSTFQHTTLRYSVMTGAIGLDAGQLANAYSLCGVQLPLSLRANPVLRALEATDPEPHLLCNVL